MSTPEEDGPPNVEHRSYPEHGVTLTPPPPAERKTNPPTPEADIMAALLRIEGKVNAIDRGLLAANDELAAIRADMRMGFEGQGQQIGRLARDVGLLREQADSALAAINVLPPRLTAIESKLEDIGAETEKSLNVACGSWLQITGGAVDEQQLQHVKQIVVSHYSRR